jgi:hypothetical protein
VVVVVVVLLLLLLLLLHTFRKGCVGHSSRPST